MLTLRDVAKKWASGKIALADVSFQAPLGSLVAVIGPSGAGKSTLLKIIAKLEDADSGQIDRPSGAVGMVFQEPSLWPHLTLLENVSKPLQIIAKLAKPKAVNRATAALEAWGLEDRLHAFPAELSGGEQQRGALARTLVMEPATLCLDEITSALDPERTAEILDRLRQLRGRNVVTVLSTHQLAFAREAADFVVFMDGGSVLEAGTPDVLMDRPQHERVFRFLNVILRSERTGVDRPEL